MILAAPQRARVCLTGPRLGQALNLCLRQVLVRRDVPLCRWRMASVGRAESSDSIRAHPSAMIRFSYETTHSAQ
jgi:hypothetical protein